MRRIPANQAGRPTATDRSTTNATPIPHNTTAQLCHGTPEADTYPQNPTKASIGSEEAQPSAKAFTGSGTHEGRKSHGSAFCITNHPLSRTLWLVLKATVAACFVLIIFDAASGLLRVALQFLYILSP
jgi:hypothetical protein